MTADLAGAGTRQIRGSTLLLFGRVLALLISTATQVLIIRLLTKDDYGAFAYGLAIVATAQIVVGLGHHQALARFFTLYEERRDYNRLFGAIAMEIGVIVTVGGLLMAALFVLDDWIGTALIHDGTAVRVLMILIVLAPIEAIDRVFEAIFAVFSKPQAIFFRKYLVGPGLRLVVVLVLLAGGASVTMLAVGYVLAGAAGAALYGSLAVRFLREGGLLQQLRFRSLVFPFREIFGFSFPLLSIELVNISLNTVSVVLLGYFSGTIEVARYSAVFPAARLNQVVLFTFTLLFAPMAARFFERGDRVGLRTAYWQTAAWLTVFSFPIFALTVPLARPLTEALFGQAYSSSAPVLALLSIAYFTNAALGFNALTLQTFGRLGYIVRVNVVCALVNVVLSLLLIPGKGAVGAAAANASALLLQNLLFQAGLPHGTGIPFLDRRVVRIYALVALAIAALVTVEMALSPPLFVGVALAAAASLGLLVASRKNLDAATTFPELLRVPIVGRLLAP